MKRFTQTFAQIDKNSLADVISAIMATIEDGLLQSGMVPEKHYSAQSIVDAALPFALATFNKSNIKFTSAWKAKAKASSPLTTEEDIIIGKLKTTLGKEAFTLLSKCDYSKTPDILRTSTNGVRVFIINPSYFENVVCQSMGQTKESVCAVLKAKNLLITMRGNTSQFTIPKRGYSTEFYTVPAAILKVGTNSNL